MNYLMNCSVAMLMQNKPEHSFTVTTSVLANFSSGLLQIAHCWQETQHVTSERFGSVQQIQSGPVSPGMTSSQRLTRQFYTSCLTLNTVTEPTP